jgi:hypothetical protein
MTHPFAGGIPYPWDRPEAKHLAEVLRSQVTQAPRIDMLYRSAADGLPALNTGQAPALLWAEALDYLALADALLAFCDVLIRQVDLPAVAAAAQAMLDAKPSFQRRIDASGRLVADRVTLREELGELARSHGPVKVVLIRGGEKSGKSWSRHLFEAAAQDRGAVMTYLYSGNVSTVEEVVDKLFGLLNAIDLIPPQFATDAAWYSQACNRLSAAAGRCGRHLWIAADDLSPGPDGVQLDPEICKFFNQFVLNLLDPAMSRWFRLLLIHYPDIPEPSRWEEELWQEDRVDAGDVSADDVAEVVREWAAEHDRNLPDDHVLSIATQVITAADEALLGGPGPAGRLRLIQAGMAAKLRELEGGQP